MPDSRNGASNYSGTRDAPSPPTSGGAPDIVTATLRKRLTNAGDELLEAQHQLTRSAERLKAVQAGHDETAGTVASLESEMAAIRAELRSRGAGEA